MLARTWKTTLCSSEQKNLETFSINIRDEAGGSVAFEHGKVIITLHFRRSKTQHFIWNGFTTYLFEFDGIWYCQKSFPYKEQAMYIFIMDQRCNEDMNSKVSSKVLPEVSCRHWKKLEICFDYWIGSIARCGKGWEYQNSGKKRLKENSLAFLEDTVSRMTSRKSIKGSTNKQIAISSSKPKKRKHKSEELDDTTFSKLKKERNWKWRNLFTKILMIAVLRVLIFSYFLLLNRVFKKASQSINIVTSLSDGGPIKFEVPESRKEFLDLARSYLYLKRETWQLNRYLVLRGRYPVPCAKVEELQVLKWAVPGTTFSSKWELPSEKNFI